MEVCNKDHEQIVHTERHCPLCEALEETYELKDKCIDSGKQLKEKCRELLDIKVMQTKRFQTSLSDGK